MSNLLRTKLSFILFISACLLGCAGSTSIQRHHHLLHDDSSAVAVYFLRPEEGLMGVRGQPIKIEVDDEELMSLRIGEYTMLRLEPGEYDMIVTSWTVEGSENTAVETSRDFTLTLAPDDSLYLYFTLEKIDFWELLKQKIEEQPFTLPIPLGKNVTLTINVPGKIYRGIGYTVKSLDREKAVEVAHKLKAVQDAEESPLRE